MMYYVISHACFYIQVPNTKLEKSVFIDSSNPLNVFLCFNFFSAVFSLIGTFLYKL